MAIGDIDFVREKFVFPVFLSKNTFYELHFLKFIIYLRSTKKGKKKLGKKVCKEINMDEL